MMTSPARLLVSWIVCCFATTVCFADQEFRINDQSTFRFATVDESKPVMTARDEFIQNLSRFDLECRLRTNQEVSVEMLLEHIPTQLLEWTDEDKQRLAPVLEKVRERLSTWNLPFPQSVLLIKTTGNEDAGAAYCRGNGIVIPQASIQHMNDSVILHELFHILSRTNPDLRRDLYEVVGFTIGPDVELPEDLQPIKLTNPDAPRVNCYIELEHEGMELTATPLLTSTAEHFDPQPGRTLFNYLQFRLLVVQKDGEVWRPKLDADGKPVFLDPHAVPSFFEKIGNNTKYIIHPEEVLADNFVLLIKGAMAVPSPNILVGMGKVLKPESGEAAEDQ